MSRTGGRNFGGLGDLEIDRVVSPGMCQKHGISAGAPKMDWFTKKSHRNPILLIKVNVILICFDCL